MATTLRLPLSLLLLLLLFAAICITPMVAATGESDLESDPARRSLYSWGYISYGAMHRDGVPCSWRGASYYNCHPGAEANPYDRGCSVITQCRR
ncbi:protein RALF-like 22 [Curcuma longa]|uniref:protein RALF-like 22 n=1 Tax=Curcuma longa TaxID=136217 RepID=UPI003D9F993B